MLSGPGVRPLRANITSQCLLCKTYQDCARIAARLGGVRHDQRTVYRAARGQCRQRLHRVKDGSMTRFYNEQGMQVPDGRWSIHSAKRIASVAALRGRDGLRSALRALGFNLL
jgi:hypothetical protein